MRERAAVVAVISLLLLLASGCSGPSRSEQIYHFDKDATSTDRADVHEGVQAMQSWLLATGQMHLRQINVYADANLNNLMSEYAYWEGIGPHQDPISLAGWFASGGALAAGRDIYIYLGPAWNSLPAADRKFLVAHETFHVAQYGLVFDQPGAQPGAPPPAWLAEGTADYAAAKALDAAGIRSYSESRAIAVQEARGHALSLEAAPPPTDVHTGDASPYAEGFLASELLASAAGDGVIIDFWQDIGTQDGWQPAFTHTFGEPISAFVTRFEEFRAETAPAFIGGISGLVTDPDGHGVWVAACDAQSRCSGTWTAHDGTFDLRLDDGNYRVRFQVGNRVGSERGRLMLPDGTSVDSIRIDGAIVSGLKAATAGF